VVHARFIPTAKLKRVFGLRLDRQAGFRSDVELGLLGLAGHLLATVLRGGNRLALGGGNSTATAAAVAAIAAAIAAVVMEEAAELAGPAMAAATAGVAAIAGVARALAARRLAAAGFATAVAEPAEPAVTRIAAIIARVAGVASIASIAAGVTAAARIPVEQTAHLVPHPVQTGLFTAAIAAGITPAAGAAGRRGRGHRCNVGRGGRVGAREPGRRYQKERSIHEVSSH